MSVECRWVECSYSVASIHLSWNHPSEKEHRHWSKRVLNSYFLLCPVINCLDFHPTKETDVINTITQVLRTKVKSFDKFGCINSWKTSSCKYKNNASIGNCSMFLLWKQRCLMQLLSLATLFFTLLLFVIVNNIDMLLVSCNFRKTGRYSCYTSIWRRWAKQ